ncbi:MAG: ABC transporter ATP-binding protein [bacterium]
MKTQYPHKGIFSFLLKRLGGSPPIEKALEVVKREVKKYRRLIFLGAVLMFLGALLLLPLPFIMGKIIDIVLPQKNVRLLLTAIGILLGVNIIASIINYFQEVLFFKINNKMIIDIRKALFQKVNRLPLFITKSCNTGYLMSRIKDDPPRLAALFGEKLIQMVKQFFVFIVCLSALFYISWELACITIAVLPFFLYTVYYFGKKIKKQSETVFERVAVNSKSLQENLDMVELCKSFGREAFNTRRYLREIIKTLRDFIVLKKLESLNSVILGFIGAILPLSILGYGGYKIIAGTFSIGMLVTFISLLSNVVSPASSLIGFNIEIQKLKVALIRVGEILHLPEEPEAEGIDFRPVDSLNVDHLMFSYNGLKPVLKNITLNAGKGEKIGIVGASGSGKTSLARVVSGLYQFAGTISINDYPVGAMQSKTLRKNVAVVPQEPFLFNDSIYANVAFGKPRATEEEVRDALIRANAWEFIEKMKDKERTLVGERGNSLSVGQKQRIAIARALIKDTDILILDEATSNVDNISAKMIADAIDDISKQKIIFIIAHNLDSVTTCDKIIYLKDGIISEEGSHEELLAKQGDYAGQYNKHIHSLKKPQMEAMAVS